MEDYLHSLLQHVREQRMGTVTLENRVALAREEAAYRALSATFTDEQSRLFQTYDLARGACCNAEEDAFGRAVFLLAKEIYR